MAHDKRTLNVKNHRWVLLRQEVRRVAPRVDEEEPNEATTDALAHEKMPSRHVPRKVAELHLVLRDADRSLIVAVQARGSVLSKTQIAEHATPRERAAARLGHADRLGLRAREGDRALLLAHRNQWLTSQRSMQT